MAKDNVDTVQEPSQPAEYAVTLEEFLSEIPQAKVETKSGFTRLCQKEGIAGMKMRSDWTKLLTLFETQPMKVSWAQWTKGGK